MNLTLAADWHIGYGESDRLQFALFVRDACGLAPTANTLPPIPPLSPRVAVREELVATFDREVLAGQWSAWWAQLFAPAAVVESRKLSEPRAELPELGDQAELQAIARLLGPDAARWSQESNRDRLAIMFDEAHPMPHSLEMQVAEEACRELKPWRRAKSWSLEVTGLPVESEQGWRISHDHVVVTRALRMNTAAYRAWLLPVLRPLVRD